MQLKNKEPSSGNLMAQKANFQKGSKTYHDVIYTGKKVFFLGAMIARGLNKRRSHERNILYKTIA